MSQTIMIILMVLQAMFWLWLAWRALTTDNFVGWKRGSASYWVVVMLLLFFAVSASAAVVAKLLGY